MSGRIPVHGKDASVGIFHLKPQSPPERSLTQQSEQGFTNSSPVMATVGVEVPQNPMFIDSDHFGPYCHLVGLPLEGPQAVALCRGSSWSCPSLARATGRLSTPPLIKTWCWGMAIQPETKNGVFFRGRFGGLKRKSQGNQAI